MLAYMTIFVFARILLDTCVQNFLWGYFKFINPATVIALVWLYWLHHRRLQEVLAVGGKRWRFPMSLAYLNWNTLFHFLCGRYKRRIISLDPLNIDSIQSPGKELVQIDFAKEGICLLPIFHRALLILVW